MTVAQACEQLLEIVENKKKEDPTPGKSTLYVFCIVIPG